MLDFFISYNRADEGWATWIAYVLEEEGFTTVVQAWDFRPGTNFVLHMQKATVDCIRTIAVLSPAYLASLFAQPEWAASFVNDPKGEQQSLVPVMVEKCSSPGLLKSIIHIDMVGSDEEQARRLLIDGLQPGRSKPSARPSFPGAPRLSHPPFPADKKGGDAHSPTYMPKVRKVSADVDKRRFIRQAFDKIAKDFERSLAAVSAVEASVECDFERRSTGEFTAEIFLHGKSKCRCRLWQG